MNIGNKLHQARINANFTQEQTAEALGISRQTVSNWENEKTYPDIRSVVILSDLYNISLDYLLKGKEKPAMNDYLDYLEESTDTVKSKTKLSKFILIIAYLLIWSFSLIVFWFFTAGSDAMAYGFVFLWVLLPVTTFVISFIIGVHNHWGKNKWIAVFLFASMYMLAEYCSFGAANMVSFNKINPPDLTMLITGSIISASGLCIGSLRLRIKEKNNK